MTVTVNVYYDQDHDADEILEGWTKDQLVALYHGEDDEGYSILRESAASDLIDKSDVGISLDNSSLREYIKNHYDVDPEEIEDEELDAIVERVRGA